MEATLLKSFFVHDMQARYEILAKRARVGTMVIYVRCILFRFSCIHGCNHSNRNKMKMYPGTLNRKKAAAATTAPSKSNCMKRKIDARRRRRTAKDIGIIIKMVLYIYLVVEARARERENKELGIFVKQTHAVLHTRRGTARHEEYVSEHILIGPCIILYTLVSRAL